ncbi:hypothetical protein PVK06_005215 [Gossypium arboreum]|uniref:Uncharacterized protein n=1 Tax=Gossypium arboreum TaxID=29729 RepID=A0ABR0QU12_GOSAR|nr:hypothetical protein PVK06_005215 [Gossypium arboreum]
MKWCQLSFNSIDIAIVPVQEDVNLSALKRIILLFKVDSLCGSSGNGENLLEELNTKKVHFKDSKTIPEVEMVAESTSTPTLSWKDMVLGKGFTESKESSDVKKSVINGILAIDFSNRVQKFLVKDMFASMIPKLLGMNIGVVALQDKVYRL